MQSGLNGHRHPNGLIDFDLYHAYAAQERRLQQRLVSRSLFAGLGHVWHDSRSQPAQPRWVPPVRPRVCLAGTALADMRT
jgi:hypothetical protein